MTPPLGTSLPSRDVVEIHPAFAQLNRNQTADLPLATTMIDLVRQEIVAGATLVVIKVGTRVLTTDSGVLDEARIERLGEEISRLKNTGRDVVLVSSGAVGAGVDVLGLEQRPQDIARLQAVAAVGQTRLIELYDRVFRRHDLRAAQILLTADDLRQRGSYLNVRNTLLSLLEFGVVPVINENDTVAVDELMTTFGDNDRLAAMVTNLLAAPLLVILSDVAGLYDGDPTLETSQVIPLVNQIDDDILKLVVDKDSKVSKGGMLSKLEAARMVTQAGESMIIAHGSEAGVLDAVFAGQPVGTLLVPQGRAISTWKRWIAYSAQPRGQVFVDTGAINALTDQGRSLLAIGITDVAGQFTKGDVISICGAGGQEFARGLSNYSCDEVDRIKGAQSERIADILGHRPYKAVVHRNNLTLLDQLEPGN